MAPLLLSLRAALLLLLAAAARASASSPVNFLFILSDDLGYGEVSFTPGRTNTNISTPHLAALASQGMVFSRAYTGAPVCAPSRGALMTGKHTGHATIRGNRGTPDGGDFPLLPSPGDRTFLQALRDAGYHVSCVGKWGLGSVRGPGDAIDKGCSDYYGVMGQSEAHNMYPTQANFTWRWPAANGSASWEALPFPANAQASRATCMAPGSGCVWTHDLWTRAALAALAANAQRSPPPPLFLYLAYTDPHAGGWGGEAEQGNPVPSDGRFAAEAWPDAEKDHASVIENFQDRDVGALVAALDAGGLADSTAVFFASDNGASNEGDHDYAFFGSSGPLRGFKRCLTEGGIRTPLLVRLPGVVPAGVVSDFPVAFWDLGDTILELAGVPERLRQDGASFAAVLASPTGAAPGPPRPLYFEFCACALPPVLPAPAPAPRVLRTPPPLCLPPCARSGQARPCTRRWSPGRARAGGAP